MSATARVDPDFRSEPSTTDAHRTARFGNPPRRPLLIGLLGSLMLLVGGFGAGGVLVRDPLMTNSVIGFWRYGHGHDIAAFLMYGGVGLLLWAWIMLGRDVLAHRIGGRAVLTNAAVWIAPLLLAPPLFTRDIFSYLAQGALPLHGFDPYAVGPDAMPGILTDNVHYFWQDTPAPYGPLFIIIAKAVAWLIGNNIIAGVLVMRLALLPGLALLVWALPELTRRLGGRVPVALWVAVANPMMVINMIGGGHNDLLVVGLLAAGALLALRGQHAGGIALVTMAMAVKASAGLALPFLVLVWAAHMSGSRWVRIAKAHGGGHRRLRGHLRRVHPGRGGEPGLAARAQRPVHDRQLDVDPDGDRSDRRVVRLALRRVAAAVHQHLPRDRRRPAAVDRGPPVVGGARRRPGRDPPRGHRAARHLGPLARHAPVVRQLGHGVPGDDPVDGAGPAVPGRRVDHAGHRLLPQRRGRPLQLGLPRGVPGGGAARRLVAGEARSAAARRGRAQQAAARRGATGEARGDLGARGGRRAARQLSRVSGSELDAAGIHDPALRAAYTTCRALNARHGRTYFLATRLLPRARRPAVHALYGFARYADEIVDDLDDTSAPAAKAARIDALAEQLAVALDGGPAAHPVLAALADTARRYAIDRAHFTDFLVSMRMDTEVTDYATFAELDRYVHGSAAVIGLQMLPILGTTVPRADAEPAAAALGVAFQLTNFLRDVGEDLDRGRVYLPADELAAFGVDRELLVWSRRTRRSDPRIGRALAHLVAHTRAVYRRAAPGIAMLEPVSRACVTCAFGLYGEILAEIERSGYAVLHQRVTVPPRRRAAGVIRALAA